MRVLFKVNHKVIHKATALLGRVMHKLPNLQLWIELPPSLCIKNSVLSVAHHRAGEVGREQWEKIAAGGFSERWRECVADKRPLDEAA